MKECRCKKEKWLDINWGTGSYKRSNFVEDDNPDSCKYGCCDHYRCKLCGKKWTMRWPD